MNTEVLNLFIWKTAYTLVTQHGFFLVNNDEGTLTLRKSEGFLTTFLWLIPGDRHTRKKIEREIEETISWMGVFRRKTPSFVQRSIHLYLFSEEKEDNFIQSIPKLGSFTLTGRYSVVSWGANLAVNRLYATNPLLPITRMIRDTVQEILKNMQQQPIPSTNELDNQINRWHHEMIAVQQSNLQTYQRKISFRKGAPLTFILAGINLVMWVLMTIAGGSTNPDTLIRFGAKYNPAILEGEYWRLITPTFLHIGGFHLWFNSIALLYLGGHVERIFGSFRFIVIYMISGIAGSLASFIFNPSISAGASGAIFGLFGAMLFFATKSANVFGHTMGPGIITALGVNLLLGFFVQGIDNYAHVGGLIGGYIVSFLIGFPRERRK